MNAQQVRPPECSRERRAVVLSRGVHVSDPDVTSLAWIAARGVLETGVCDLIHAAGPLTLDDIAGGLDVARDEASKVLVWMLECGRLRQDEWERYELRDAAGDRRVSGFGSERYAAGFC